MLHTMQRSQRAPADYQANTPGSQLRSRAFYEGRARSSLRR
jgi:hypothetical protein